MRTFYGIAFLSVLLLLFAGCRKGQETADVDLGEVYGPAFFGAASGYNCQIYMPGSESNTFVQNEGYHPPNGTQATNPTGYGVQLVGRHLNSPSCPVIYACTVSFFDVQCRRKPFHVTEVGGSKFSAHFTDADVNAFLNQRAHPGKIAMRDIRMTFTPQAVQTTATITLNNKDVTATGTGALRPLHGTQVVYLPTSFTANSVVLPASFQQDLVNQLNPVIDVSAMNCHPQIKSITLDQGTATLEGTATPANLP